MLKSIQLRNFKKHEKLEIEFDAGLTALRGANENGKSTVLHAIAYALFGAKSLTTSLEDTVTWGKPVSSLSVKLTLEIEGTEYVIMRAKSGAEINYEYKERVCGSQGGKVTGQNECSAFISRLFGTDPDRIMRLILANQGNIRGALEQGPKATTELIEKLSNFDVLDQVVNLIQDNLLLGSSAVFEQRVTTADEQVAALQLALKEPDVEDASRQVELLTAQIGSARSELANTWLPKMQQAKLAYETAQKLYTQIEQQHTQVGNLRKEMCSLVAQKEQALTQSVVKQDPGTIDALRKQIETASGATQQVKVYEDLAKLNAAYPESFWEGDLSSLQAEIAETEKKIRTTTTLITLNKEFANITTNTINSLKSGIEVLLARKVTGSACGFCGQDTSQFPEIAKSNSGIDENIKGREIQIETESRNLASMKKQTEQHNVKLSSLKEDLAALQAVLKSAEPINRFIRLNANTVDIDEQFVPSKVTWKGAVPSVDMDVAALQRELQTREQQNKEADIATGRMQALEKQIVMMEGKVKKAEWDLTSLGALPRLEPLQEVLAAADATYVEHQNAIYDHEATIKAIQAEIDKEVALYRQAVAQIEAAKAEQVRALSDLEQLRFNNNLLKRVKSARPVIADRLWSVVLNAVSVFFSQMRGEKSSVTKEKDGFRVNGQTIDGLSGSTLDALGLAVRAALTKTFLPHLPFLILDEPFAAMDEQRSMATLGLVASLGFKQTLLVTHEANSENFADNLIMV